MEHNASSTCTRPKLNRGGGIIFLWIKNIQDSIKGGNIIRLFILIKWFFECECIGFEENKQERCISTVQFSVL